MPKISVELALRVPEVRIPTRWLVNTSGSWFSKFLLGALIFLAKDKGYCVASSQYLTRLLGINAKTIQCALQQLQDNGWVSVSTQRGELNKIGVKKELIVSTWGKISNG